MPGYLVALAAIVFAVCTIAVVSQQEPLPRDSRVERAKALEAAREKFCTAEIAATVDLVVIEAVDTRMRVRAPLWVAASPSLRTDLAAWVSVCRFDGGPVYVFSSEDSTLFGSYTRANGYKPEPMQ